MNKKKVVPPWKFRVTVSVAPDVHKRLLEYSQPKGLLMNRVVDDAINAHIERMEKFSKDSASAIAAEVAG